MALADYLPADHRNPVAREIARAARRYLARFNEFSYDFNQNGEQRLLSKIRTLHLSTVFDVGANLGHWCETASALLAEAKFHTFEISEKTHRNLCHRLPGKRFTHNCLALGESEGVIQYKDYGADSALNTTVTQLSMHDAQLPWEWKQAPLTTGTRYCQDRGIEQVDFLKIDVEGAEHRVLLGFDPMFRLGKTRLVQFEYGYANGDAHFLMRDFFDFFRCRGYLVAKIRNGPLEFRPFEYAMNNFDSGPNYLAVHQNDSEIITILTSV